MGIRIAAIVFVALVAAVLAPAAEATTVERPPGQSASIDPGCSETTLEASASSALPVSPGTCRGVRPGAWVFTSVGRCSFNFMFAGSDGHTYAGTAAHCPLKDNQSGEFVWAPGDGPGSWDADEEWVGEFAYAVYDAPGTGDTDFALIRVDPTRTVEPSMCYWGGPTGLYTDHELLAPENPMVVRHYGGGLGLGETVPARTGHAIETLSETTITWNGAVVWGDSGSGLIHRDGRAMAVNVRLVGSSAFGTMSSTRIDHQLALAEEALDIELTLLTAPLAEALP